jgi:hypothetical protein
MTPLTHFGPQKSRLPTYYVAVYALELDPPTGAKNVDPRGITSGADLHSLRALFRDFATVTGLLGRP